MEVNAKSEFWSHDNNALKFSVCDVKPVKKRIKWKPRNSLPSCSIPCPTDSTQCLTQMPTLQLHHTGTGKHKGPLSSVFVFMQINYLFLSLKPRLSRTDGYTMIGADWNFVFYFSQGFFLCFFSSAPAPMQDGASHAYERIIYFCQTGAVYCVFCSPCPALFPACSQYFCRL